jgi:hypothetical protein
LARLGGQGFRIDGAAAGDHAGRVAAAGDVNGDGLGDVLVGAPYRSDQAGSVYVVFGQSSLKRIDLARLGKQGFRIDGPGAGQFVGVSAAGVGDLNGDRLADVIVGTYGGSSYVVFGKRSSTPVALARLGDRGFRIDGERFNDLASRVAAAGDVDGDGLTDLIVGAFRASRNGRSESGSAYVVFGKRSPTNVELAALGRQGFRIDGAAAHDQTGFSVAGLGDVNGDKLADVVVGAWVADHKGRQDSGSAYVVFGKRSSEHIDLAALGNKGFRIGGAADGDLAGYSVAGVGDVNGDKRPDLLVGAYGVQMGRLGSTGAAYVVFGKGSPASVDLAKLANQGFRIDGAADGDRTGDPVAGVGDLNGDGLADLLVGAYLAGNNNRPESGSAYIVFGRTSTTPVELAQTKP